jgi:hypothetical protein
MNLTWTLNKIAATAALTLTLSTFATAQNSNFCANYPTRCHPPAGPTPQGPFGIPAYAGNAPIYPPSVLVPGLRSAVQGALDALPPAYRQQLYPSQIRDAVRSGAIDAATENALQTGFDSYGQIITGTGPGGSAYTDARARAIKNGTDPIWQMGAAMSPYAIPLDQQARAARARQKALTRQQQQRQQMLVRMQQEMMQRLQGQQ